MRKAAILGLFLLSAAFVFGGFLASNSRPAHAVTYEAQCTSDGGKLKWDGVGLRWCCSKVQKWMRHPKVVILWCKS